MPLPDPPFGFELIPPGTADEDSRREDWTVRLPHQCGSWIIAADPSRQDVLAEVLLFRAELDKIITALQPGT